MTTIERERRYIRKRRPAALRGDILATQNIAAAYRLLGSFRLTARWFRKTAELGDGDAMTDWGYCLHHGAGVRRNEKLAEQAYRSAIASKWICDYSRE